MFGDSLLWVIDKYNSVYYSHAQLLYTKTGNQNSSNNSVAAPPHAQALASHSGTRTPTASGGRQGADAGSPAAAEKGKVVTANESEKGTSICKKFNDRRGCTWPCKQGKAHTCDVVLQNGRVCNKSHARFEHDNSKHGVPQIRSS